MLKTPTNVMRRHPRALLYASAAALTLGTLLATSDASADPGTTTIRVHSAPVTETRLPEPADPNAPIRVGDRLLWVAELYQGARHVGSASHVCTAADARWLDCTATVALPRGQIQVQVALDLEASDTPRIAVTGGSDCYRQARGQLTITPNSDGSSEWVFWLTGTC